LFTCADFTDTTGTKVGISSAGRAKQPSLAALIQLTDAVERDHAVALRPQSPHPADRLGDDPPLLLIAPPSAADRARYLRAALNDLRVVTNVDHNVHTILYFKRIAIVHHSPSLSYVG